MRAARLMSPAFSVAWIVLSDRVVAWLAPDTADILLEARVLAVADVVEAMCTDRPYRPALGTKEALDELDRGDGRLYDSDVVRACKKLLNERSFKPELVGSRS